MSDIKLPRPVAWLSPESGQVLRDGDITNPEAWAIGLHTEATVHRLIADAQPKREPLTEHQIADIARQEALLMVCDDMEALVDIARAIERAHGIIGDDQ